MTKIAFSFEIPITRIIKKNGLTHSRKAGDLTVYVDNDEEVYSVMYGAVDVLPLIETMDAMNFIFDAVDSHLEYLRIEKDIDEENQEAI